MPQQTNKIMKQFLKEFAMGLGFWATMIIIYLILTTI